uniref:Protein asunder n=1 Tax=Rhodnius prolixus TaxID=13249 RepID=T1HKS4_RHOPR
METMLLLDKYFPENDSSNMIYFKHYMEPISSLIKKSELREYDLIECKRNIYSLAYNEVKQEPLIPAGLEANIELEAIQYHHIWTELKSLIREHCITEKHVQIMNCLLEVKSKDFSSIIVKDELEQSLKELNRLCAENFSVKTPLLRETISFVQKTVLELWMERYECKNSRPEFAGMCNAQLLPNGNMKSSLYPNLINLKSFYKSKKD